MLYCSMFNVLCWGADLLRSSQTIQSYEKFRYDSRLFYPGKRFWLSTLPMRLINVYIFIKSPLNLQLRIFWFIQGFQLGHIQMVLVGTYSCTHSLIKSVRPMAYSFRSIIEFFQSTKSQLVTKSFLCLPWRALYIPSSGIMLFSCCPYEWSRGTIRWLKSPRCMQPMERQTSLIVV